MKRGYSWQSWLLALATIAVGSGLYALLQWAVYGHVRWR